MMLVIHGRLECFSCGLLAIAKLIKGKRKEVGEGAFVMYLLINLCVQRALNMDLKGY